MRARSYAGLLLLIAAAAACGRQDAPTSANPREARAVQANGVGPRRTGGYVTTFIECVVAVTGTPSTSCGSGSQPYLSRARGALITQQCAIACVEALAPTYDAKHGWWVVQVRVRDQSFQALGTVDGTTPSSWKTSVVLVEAPRSVAGLGTIAVVGPTTRISAHPSLPLNTLYSAYPGITRRGETTEWRPWTFQVPRGVTRFAFRVAVVADVEALVKFSEVNVGLRSGAASAGVILEMDNVGSAAITHTTLVIVDSIMETKSVVVATMPITDDWPTRGRRIVASADLRAVLNTPIYGLFPSQYVFDPARSHRIRVRVGSRTGRVLDELWINANTVRLAGFGSERTYSDYAGTVTKLYYPAWVSSTTKIPTRCAGAPTCPVLTGSPGQ